MPKGDHGWLIVAYDLPNEPSRLRLKAWRNLKKLGAVYPSVSLCVLPDTPEVRKKMGEARSDIGDEGSVFIMSAKPLGKIDGGELLRMFQEDRHKQYDEIYEEFEEFLDEIEENVGNKNVTPEETDELEHALEGLEKWYRNIRAKGYERTKDVEKVDKIMEECKKALRQFSESAQPREINS